MRFLFLVSICVIALNFRALLLCADYTTVKGVIREKYPNNHLGIEYSYEVNRYLYSGKSYAGQIDRQFDEIRLGDLVTVYYSKLMPNYSTLEVPSVLLVQRVGIILGLCVILPTIGLCILRYRDCKSPDNTK